MTLEPGVYDPSEAPWWEFYADGMIVTTIKQWMGEAALYFAHHMSLINLGGKVTVEVSYMTTDGMIGYYNISFEHHMFPSTIVVRRGNIQEAPNASDQL